MKKHDDGFENMRFQVKRKYTLIRFTFDKFRFEVKDKVEDFLSEEKGRFVNGR